MIKKLLKMALVSVMIGAFMGCGAGSSSPEAAAEQMMKYMLDGKVENAVNALRDSNGKVFQGDEKTALNGKLTMSLAQYQDKGKAKSIKANEAQYNKDKTRARVAVIVEYDSGKKSTDNFNVILVDGKWFVTI